jgi:hypothetical protein
MALRAVWQFMDRDVTFKILYVPKRSWGSYTILWMTDRSINCHLARSAMNYLLYYTQYMQICQIKIIFNHFGSFAGIPARVIVLWQENVGGTRNTSFEGDRYNVVFKYQRQRSNGLKICLPAVFYIPVYVFSWFHSV